MFNRKTNKAEGKEMPDNEASEKKVEKKDEEEDKEMKKCPNCGKTDCDCSGKEKAEAAVSKRQHKG